GVRVAHQHDRRGVVRLTEVAHEAEHLCEADTLGQRAFAGALDDRAVGHGIGERHAELDHVAAGVRQYVHQLDGVVRLGVARGDVGNQRLAAAGGQGLEGGGDAAHCASFAAASAPDSAATVPMSLSPRPDRFTSRIWSLRIVGASLMAWATAWLDSSAGMMPSVRHRRWKAASASSSVMPTYSARPMSFRCACSGPTPG